MSNTFMMSALSVWGVIIAVLYFTVSVWVSCKISSEVLVLTDLDLYMAKKKKETEIVKDNCLEVMIE